MRRWLSDRALAWLHRLCVGPIPGRHDSPSLWNGAMSLTSRSLGRHRKIQMILEVLLSILCVFKRENSNCQSKTYFIKGGSQFTAIKHVAFIILFRLPPLPLFKIITPVYHCIPNLLAGIKGKCYLSKATQKRSKTTKKPIHQWEGELRESRVPIGRTISQ